ncbi:MAG: NADPH-dependent glutamate synthase [Tissierellia bacterium]|jgi:glutamate synthase (NADPH/NADH) small chain|nr:NADPH-dependent glutamate synthase [Tissierellia bacterium]
MDRFKRVEISYQEPKKRIQNFDEVCLGYTSEEAIQEAKRCIQCKNPTCVDMCPVRIDIPRFIKNIAENEFEEASKTLSKYTNLPAVCGRVCPQEEQCESTCILGKKGDPIAIGKLERFAADFGLEKELTFDEVAEKNHHKVAVIGSGPAGITCAGELAKKGYEVTMFEALHRPGGVLEYGIPEFRLPKDKIVKKEIDNLKRLGVEIKVNTVIGRTITIDQLKQEEYVAFFLGSGAGSPLFLNIPGENLNGVYSANEYLTRNNLMKAYLEESDTPIRVGKNVVVIGGGNVAMDAARTARRYGSNVTVVYRRTKAELPARDEEIENAIEEGINFNYLSTPLEIIGNEIGEVEKIKLVRMKLGRPDESGRRRPIPDPKATYEISADMVIIALGTNPNPLIPDTTANLGIDSQNKIIVDEKYETTLEGIFAGGDIVTGSATVILAMGAGKMAAEEIDKYIKEKYD